MTNFIILNSGFNNYEYPVKFINPSNHSGGIMIKKRNMIGQVGLIIITFGIYAIYWFYKISEEMAYVGKDTQASPALWTVLLFVPFANIWSYYKFSELYEKISSDHFNKWLLFVLWLVFSPAVWFIVQTEMNKKADQQKIA